jgi:sulfate transport system ATP-binding protein
MSIEILNLSKAYGTFPALREVSLEIPDGQLVALLGPSGSGKTTLLRIIAGLEAPDEGRIVFHGEDATGRDVRDRRVGFVFQHYALFRHMTVFENVAFGLRVRPRRVRAAEAEIRAAVTDLLRLVQLDWLADRSPGELSGGQRQRVALARALAVKPRLLLLDEPFGALDAQVRKELRRWLRRLHEEVRVTSVFVTHDQEEAMEVADRVVVMNEGRVEQMGTPEEVYDGPATPFVLSFLGNVTLFHGRIHDGRLTLGEAELEAPGLGDSAGAASVYVRSHDFEVVPPGTAGALEAVVRHVRAFGPAVRLEVDRVPDGQTIEVELPRERFERLTLRRGDRVLVRPVRVRSFGGDLRAPG